MKLRIKMLSRKSQIQLLYMVNGLHLLYKVHVRGLVMRYLIFYSCQFIKDKEIPFMPHISPEPCFFMYPQHGAAVIQDKMYVYGGNHNGRYLNDLHVSKLPLLMLKETLLRCFCVMLVADSG